ncbi:MAG TPA: trypsin-like peptidase domain-containing protein [Candidatus Limnocylindrales bacterium]|nr:trypsin-like peptidase domain-containing protein [Candidatus Limnocylindrales bacterium]
MDTVSAVLPAAVSIVTKEGSSGSGVIVSGDGWILTNRHVVDCETRVDLTFQDGRGADATVEAIDSLTDLALIRTSSAGLTPATLGQASALEIGQPVAAIGNSEGYLANTVTSGVVSALWRQVYLDDEGEYRNLIQTDAAIYGGNSGGPLINLAGEVVGINTVTAVTDDLVRAQSLSFAIPSDLAAPIVKQVVAGTALRRPWLGIRHVPVDAGVVDREQLTASEGALVWPRVGDDGKTRPAVSPNSPAEAAGLRQGDVITAVDDIVVDGRHPLDNVLVGFEAGADVTLTIVRDSQERDVPVRLGEREGRPVGC